MKLTKYGITLNRLQEEEYARACPQWRMNQFHGIQRKYHTECSITGWIGRNNNFYFIIEYQGKKIGMINSSHIEWDTVSSEGGIFYMGSAVL